MALSASRTLLALFVTVCAPGCGWTAEKPLRPHNGKQASVVKSLRESWEPPIHLDGKPVERFSISSSKPMRSHRFAKMGKDNRTHPLEDVDPEWVNLDGFAVVGGAPVSNSSATKPDPKASLPTTHRSGLALSPRTAARNQPRVQRASRVDRTAHPSGVSTTRTHRRPPQSSSGPRQPERALARAPLLERRRYYYTKPQSDQRNRNMAKLTSESVHVVSLQAQKASGQSTTVNRAVATKAATPEPQEYEAKDIGVRVMSPQSVLISWVDPPIEMGKITPGGSRYYTVKYREKGESARWEYKESTQRRMMIDTLSADGMYEFSVRISQGENHGKWSVSVFQRTPESAPSGPPENFEVKPLRGKGTAVTATWDPPEESNGKIREYILSYAPAMKPFGMKSVTYRGSTTSATIEGLIPGDRYIFKIRATNRKGQGPQSKVFSVAMPGTSSAASSSSKNSRRTSHIHSKKERYNEKTDLQSTEVTEEPTTPPRPPPASSANRRVRPLSQSRSYHSIFSSVRGSVRNGMNRGSLSRGRTQDRDNEEKEEEEEITTAPPPAEETTTAAAAVAETKEPDYDVTPESEDEEIKPQTLETPSLKVVTPSPTKPAHKPPNTSPRRPIKIRVHQRPTSKGSPSSSSSSSSSGGIYSKASYASSSFSFPSTSSPSTTSLSSSSQIQETAESKKDNTASTYTESKKTYAQPSTRHTKPSTPAPKQTTSQLQTGAQPVGRGSSAAERTNGYGFSSRYGYGRRNHGILFRGNSTRLQNGFKPGLTSAVISQSNFPSRSQNQATTSTRSSATLLASSQNHETSNTFNSAMSRSTSAGRSHNGATSNTYNVDKSTSTSQSRLYNPTSSKTLTSQSNLQHPSSSGSSHSTSHRGSHSSAPSHNTHDSHSSHSSRTSGEQDTTYREGNDDSNYKNTGTTNGAELTPSTHSTTSEAPTRVTDEERGKEGGREEGSHDKPAPSRISPSLLERFPWLASRYPNMFGSGTRVSSSRQDGRAPWSRTSSSVGSGRPVSRGTPTRVSGATGAAGVSSIQETNEDLKTPSTHDSLKNGARVGSLKPSLTNQNTDFTGNRNPSTSSTSSSSASTSSNSNSHPSSSGNRDSSQSIHSGTSNEDNNDHSEDNDKRGTEMSGKKAKVQDSRVGSKIPTVTSLDPHRTAEDNESVDTRESSSRTGSGSSSGIPPLYRRPTVGVNGRVRSPHLANRQFGSSRFSIRPQPAQNTRLGSSTSDSSSTPSSSSSSSSSANVPQTVLTSDRAVGSSTTLTKTGGLIGGSSQSTSSSSSSLPSSPRDSLIGQGGRSRYPILRGKPTSGGGLKPTNGHGKNGRPNLTATNEKDRSGDPMSKSNGQRFITGPDGTKWVVDLEKGVLMNQDGQILQDSQGRPKRVVLGEDGRTIFDHMGSPLVNEDGLALFGHNRDSRPVVNPKDKVITFGGKPVVGLDRPHHRTSTTTRTTTTALTTTPEPTTTEWIEESTTPPPYPTCPPGTFSKTDEYGYPLPDAEGILDCYPEEESSGMEMDYMVAGTMLPDALAVQEDEFFDQTTLPPPTTTTAAITTTTTTTTTTTATTTTTTTKVPTAKPDTAPVNKGPSSEFDLSGRKRFTAPYVNYIQKDPGSPCSLTEALDYLQMDVLEDLIQKDNLAANHNQPPKNKPNNLTVIAMEGCHSFIILDWGRPLKDDMVSAYRVYSASYDDVLSNRWSSKASSGTHLAVENLKPNSRYYFKVQAKNVYGLGPISDTLTYVTESDDPLLIERPPGGEPIWIPFTFKYNSVHSACKGSQFVKRTWYRKFVGVVLCNSLRYKIFMGDGLREPFHSIADTLGQGEDHCQFVDSYMDGRTGPAYFSNNLPTAQGYYRAYRQEPVTFGVIGRRTPHPFVGWYECGVPIPGKW